MIKCAGSLICVLVAIHPARPAEQEALNHATPAENGRSEHSLEFVTPAYRARATAAILAEANSVARALGLREKLPISSSDIAETYITPPALMSRLGAVGNISTSNYTYFVSVARRLSFVIQRNPLDFQKLRIDYLWPIDQLDTNAAFNLATELLEKAGMDVAALNRDCHVQVDAFTPEGRAGAHFVPLYWIYWIRSERGKSKPSASVEIFLPSRTLRQLRVNQPEYILRKPISVDA